ncbi:DUF4411 family protein [Micromonospora globbae]|uniref:DUF4411 family protein n=1 Tax=Micromonospora globbae TaxID=1894969 RepID=UPI0034315A24
MPLYSFDTSVFIETWHRLLPPTVFVTLWQRLDDLIDEGLVRAVDEVKVEIDRRDDAVKVWASQRPHLFVPLEEDIQRSTTAALTYCERMVGFGGGRSGGDPFVIGLAHARGGTVVTEESASGNLNKPRIPDVCDAMGIKCINMVGFIQEQGWTF